ncbi:ferrous iron transport protein A [Marispirochaeta sp.]|uniref:FeoA family protein n=1 Tax=Marispirochaeta sp. TaxID=2038653 RepID=UPI0029C94A12|nr:ferrous iron transport protein A [Marispirochaeta sp.]
MNNDRTLHLAQMRPGESAVITGYLAGGRDYRRKLLSFGLTAGTKITLLKTAPLGDPVEISVRGYSLSLRKTEAAVLELRGEA